MQNEYAVFFLFISGHFHLARIMLIQAVVNRNVCWLGFFVRLTQLKTSGPRETSVKKLPQLDWPGGIPVVYFCDLPLMLESKAGLGQWNA